jgi:hypothetical protein
VHPQKPVVCSILHLLWIDRFLFGQTATLPTQAPQSTVIPIRMPTDRIGGDWTRFGFDQTGNSKFPRQHHSSTPLSCLLKISVCCPEVAGFWADHQHQAIARVNRVDDLLIESQVQADWS